MIKFRPFTGHIQFVDPITRQTYPHDTTQNCSDRIKNFFQLVVHQEDTWYTQTPGIVHQDKPTMFGPQDINPVASYTFTGSQDAGMYTHNQLKGFWDSILINAASRTALENFSQNLIVYTTDQEGTDGSHYYTPRTEFFMDKLISPGISKDQFLGTFGPFVYVFEHCGIFFSVFWFIKLIFDMVVLIVRYMEIEKISGCTLGFGKTLLSSSCNLFLTTVLTSIYNPRAPAITTVEHMEVSRCVENDMHEVREDVRKEEEHLYPAMSTVTPPMSPV